MAAAEAAAGVAAGVAVVLRSARAEGRLATESGTAMRMEARVQVGEMCRASAGYNANLLGSIVSILFTPYAHFQKKVLRARSSRTRGARSKCLALGVGEFYRS